MDNFGKKFHTVFTRAVQYTEEKLGGATATRFEGELEQLLQECDRSKAQAERIVRCAENLLQPNPNIRMEEFVYQKLDRRLRDRTTTHSELGAAFTDAGNVYGPSTSYGNALIQIGEFERKLGDVELNFVSGVAETFLTPLRQFLEGDMKTVLLRHVQKERRELMNKRLDLDSAKNKQKKTRSTEMMSQDMLDRADQEVRVAQNEFDKQAEIVKLLLEGITSSQANHLKYLFDFVDCQLTYHVEAAKVMQVLKEELSTVPLPSIAQQNELKRFAPPPGSRKARVLCDFEGNSEAELSIQANNIVFVTSMADGDGDWLHVQEANGRRGKVPSTYLEFLE